MTTVLVVDDSALVRKVLSGFFADAGFSVATARSGADALSRLEIIRPDVITLDVQMPGMDGLSVLDRIMREHPVPVVMVSVLTAEGSRTTLEALSLGAVDFVAKPDASVSLRLDEVRDELVSKVRQAAHSHVRGAGSRVATTTASRSHLVQTDRRPVDLVVIGSSTGGPAVLTEIVAALPESFPPVVVAQHLPASFTRHLSERLGRLGPLKSEEVVSLSRLTSGVVYVGRGDADVVVVRRAGELLAKTVPSLPSLRWHPSVDRLTRSALECVQPSRVIGVLLSGMGDDGANAMTELAARGGRTIAESEQSSVVWGMPGALVALEGATTVLDAEAIAAQLAAWVSEPAGSRGLSVGTAKTEGAISWH